MDVILYYADINKPFSEYEKYLSFVSPERYNKILNYKFDKDKTISLFSHLLAKHEISLSFNIPFSEINFLYNEYGKPYIEKEDFHFSVSHSDNLIAYVSHHCPVGIDVQKIKPVISPAIRFLTDNEQNYVNDDPDKFFKIWTMKESYAKMLGTGLCTPLKSFDVLSCDKKDLFFTKQLADFSLSVCAKDMDQINIKIVD